MRYAVIALFVAVSCLPLIANRCVAEGRSRSSIPPYYPPEIQKVGRLDEGR